MNTAIPYSAAAIKQANRRLYDAVADRYEGLDGRRDETLLRWIRGILGELALKHGNGILLDLGTGSGVVIRAADQLFRRSLAMDISPRMLATLNAPTNERIAADVDAIPLRDNSVDVIACFAVLHHLPGSSRLAGEVVRVLRPGGVFWSDHDIELEFCRRYRGPLKLYRSLRAAKSKYSGQQSDLETSVYEAAECRENGVDAVETVRDFQAAGLETLATYHWFGLARWSNRLFGTKPRRRGHAPLLRITATKPN